MAKSQPCTLYYDPRSICSSMVRYTLLYTGSPSQGSLPLDVEPHRIDIFNGEQLTEFYLCEVNPKGQVPVLFSKGFLDAPIRDSLDITLWLCDRFPSLKAAEHADDIVRLLRELHAINYFTLSMRNTPHVAGGLEGAIREKVKTPNLSEKHKEALQYKLKVTRTEKVNGLKPEVITAEVERARVLLQEIDEIRKQSNGQNLEGGWIFGTSAPTALDTTLVCFVARLMDRKLEEIIPVSLLQLARKARATQQFKDIWATL
ncbi:hypothetical protein H2200_011452 [Cladophialophora chaetospira]|uniref:GST N-terminal domain-containing protein n=1 Tax=Cladophialophora chaetospira TaxID=386627 RepID=A0AA38WZD3_9EURO|nr:hypothetical protein H2200_011452 [Cladophialophora chaetospira]